MAQKKIKNSPRDAFNLKGLSVFVVLFALVGGLILLKSNAARLATQTEYLDGVTNISTQAGSSNYAIVSDKMGNSQVQVAKIDTGGMLSYGGAGGGTTASPSAQQFCYVMRVDAGTSATVQLMGTNGGVATVAVKAWPYSASPVPYQYSCVTKGTILQEGPLPDIHVLSGGPVYVYGRENLVTYPY